MTARQCCLECPSCRGEICVKYFSPAEQCEQYKANKAPPPKPVRPKRKPGHCEICGAKFTDFLLRVRVGGRMICERCSAARFARATTPNPNAADCGEGYGVP